MRVVAGRRREEDDGSPPPSVDMMDWVRHPSHMMPTAVREHLNDWWEAVQGGPLVELCVDLDADEVGEEEELYLRAIVSLMPVVRSTVFTASPAIEKLVRRPRSDRNVIRGQVRRGNEPTTPIVVIRSRRHCNCASLLLGDQT